MLDRRLTILVLLSGALMYLNEATLLNNVRRRYKKDLIYVCSCDGDRRE